MFPVLEEFDARREPQCPLLNASCWPQSHNGRCSPGRGELHVCVKEAGDLGGGRLPALDARADQTLALMVPHDLHQPGVPLVHVLLQRALELL